MTAVIWISIGPLYIRTGARNLSHCRGCTDHEQLRVLARFHDMAN